jgi:flagellar assembly protein FliH
MPDRERPTRILEGVEDLPRPFVDPLVGGTGEDGEAGADPLEAALERGREEGRAEGERRAAEAFERKLEECRDKVSGALKELGELQGNLAREYKSLLVELALEAASRIAREKIEEGDPVAARALEQALKALPSEKTIQARLHPDDIESVRRDLADLITRRKVDLRPDESVSRGGCVVESGSGRIDATLETATEKVRGAAEGRPETV